MLLAHALPTHSHTYQVDVGVVELKEQARKLKQDLEDSQEENRSVWSSRGHPACNLCSNLCILILVCTRCGEFVD